jgi:hypothetical protein
MELLMYQSLQAFENFYSRELNSQFCRSFRKADYNTGLKLRIDDFAQFYADTWINLLPEIPALKPGELRPLIWSPDTYRGADVRRVLTLDHGSSPIDTTDPAEVSEAVKHHLLYCHQLAIYDPFLDVLEPFGVFRKARRTDLLPAGAGYGTDSSQWWSGRVDDELRISMVRSLGWWLEALMPLRELIKDGTLQVLPRMPVYSSLFLDESERAILRSCLKQESHDTGQRSTDIWSSDGYDPQSLAHNLATLFAKVEHLENKVTPYIPTYDHWILLRYLLTRTALEQRNVRPNLSESRVLLDLLKLRVPTFERLSVDDVATVRDTDAFRQFRADLRSALLEVRSIDASDPQALANAREWMSDSMTKATQSIVSRPSLPRRIARLAIPAGLAFGIGSIPDFATGNPLALAAAAGASVTSVAVNLILARTNRPDRALLQHYALMTEMMPHAS